MFIKSPKQSTYFLCKTSLSEVDYASTLGRFQVCEVLKNRSVNSQCYFKKPCPQEKFHSYQQIDCCETPKNLC